jgi:hypothetical protein
MDLASDQVFADLDFVEISQTTLGATEEATANVPARKGLGPTGMLRRLRETRPVRLDLSAQSAAI